MGCPSVSEKFQHRFTKPDLFQIIIIFIYFLFFFLGGGGGGGGVTRVGDCKKDWVRRENRQVWQDFPYPKEIFLAL